jgi:hypothetical protein
VYVVAVQTWETPWRIFSRLAAQAPVKLPSRKMLFVLVLVIAILALVVAISY